MRKNKVKQAVKAVKKELKNDIDVVSVIDCLKKYGYETVLFNTPAGDDEIKRYNLEKQKELKAFAFSEVAHIVFIDVKLSTDDKLYLLLHELGHIVLKHLGDGKLIYRNRVLIDIEANAFAYELLRWCGRYE